MKINLGKGMSENDIGAQGVLRDMVTKEDLSEVQFSGERSCDVMIPRPVEEQLQGP